MRNRAIIFTLSINVALIAQSVPTTINYQGRLTDNTPAQTPVNATVPMKFAIYDASTAGTNLWQEPASGGVNVLVVNGIFNVALGGNGVAIPPAVFTGATSTRYLETTVNPGTPSQEILTPRQLITAGGYANLAQSANSAVTATTATTANNSSQLGGVADTGWQKKLATPACPGGQSLTTLNQDGTSACAAPPAAPTVTDYAFAFDTLTQTVITTNVFQGLTFNTNVQLDGWTHSASTPNFICATSGLYRVHYTAVAQVVAGAPQTASLRLIVNGFEVMGSVTGATITTNNGTLAIAHEALFPVTAGDTLQLQLAGTSTNIRITPAPGTGVTRPSATLVIERVK